MKKRIWEIDAARGIAIIIMVLFHFYYDMNEIFGIDFPHFASFDFISVVFIFLCGVSSTFSRNNIKRGVQLVLWGVLITVVSLVALPNEPIIFGILHFLGVASILYGYFFEKCSNGFLLVVSAVVFVLGFAVETVTLPYLWIIGITPEGFASADYFPLIPNLMFFLLGVVFARLVYAKRESKLPYFKAFQPLIWLGQKSLWIYLIHQPLMIPLIWLVIKIT